MTTAFDRTTRPLVPRNIEGLTYLVWCEAARMSPRSPVARGAWAAGVDPAEYIAPGRFSLKLPVHRTK